MLALCEAFHVLPSAVLAEDAGLLRMLRVRALGAPPDKEGEGRGW